MQLNVTRKHLVIGIAAVIGLLLLYAGLNQPLPQDSTAATIQINGMIASGGSVTDNNIDPATVQDLIDQAQSDNVAAFLFKINSGGGSVVASKTLARAVKRIDKPTACILKDVAASGAYWVASACDRIVADSLTLTGSIGVKASYLEFSGLMDDLGVEYVNITAGDLKDAGSPYKNLTDKERQMFQEQLDTVHQEFIRSIADNRNLSLAAVRNYSTGEIFLGREAQQNGFVDRLGGTREAINLLENLTGRNITSRSYKPDTDFNILSLLLTKVGYGIGSALKSGENLRGIAATSRVR